MAKATETPAVSSARGRQLQATVAQDIYDAFNDYHWEARKDLVDLVRDALLEYGVANGFLSIDEQGNVTAVKA